MPQTPCQCKLLIRLVNMTRCSLRSRGVQVPGCDAAKVMVSLELRDGLTTSSLFGEALLKRGQRRSSTAIQSLWFRKLSSSGGW